MSVPFQDLSRLHTSIADELGPALRRVAASSAFIGGDEVASFERSFAVAHGQDDSVSCGSGTDALALAIRALGLGPGDEVIVPAMTFIATAEAVVHAGAVPVLADVDPTTLLITPASVEAVRTPRTRAVIAVHLYGNVVPFDHLRAMAATGILVIEDAAQAHLATDGGQPVGTVGHATCFSFYPGKNLGAWGDGGALLSPDPALLDRVRLLRDHGSSTKYVHETIGWCSRLDGLQAAVLDVKLRHLEAWTETRRVLARRYADHLGDLLVPWTDGSVHHLLVVRVEGGRSERTRRQEVLAVQGVQTGIHYPVALSDQPAMSAWARPCPEAEAASASVLSLPIDPLMNEGEVDLVCELYLESGASN